LPKPFEPRWFSFVVDDPLAEEHAAVMAFVEEALRRAGHRYYEMTDLKTISSGVALLGGDAERARRIVVAATIQARHLDREADRLRATGDSEFDRVNVHLRPEWAGVWGRRRQAGAVIHTLLRRSLPLRRDDLVLLANWCIESQNLSKYSYPLGAIARAFIRHAEAHGLDEDLEAVLRRFANELRGAGGTAEKRLATTIDGICPPSDVLKSPAAKTPCLPPPRPAPAGSPFVLRPLKRLGGIAGEDSEPTTTLLEPDRFAMPDDSPLRREHAMVGGLLSEAAHFMYTVPDIGTFPAGRAILALDEATLAKAILAAVERHAAALVAGNVDYEDRPLWQSRAATRDVAKQLLRQDCLPDRDTLFDLLLFLALAPSQAASLDEGVSPRLVGHAERHATESPLTEGERHVLSLFRNALVFGPPLGVASDDVRRVTALIGDGAEFFLVPGEVWADALNRDLTNTLTATRAAWIRLLEHVRTATSARPSAKWLATAQRHVVGVGAASFRDGLRRWLPLVSEGRSDVRLPSFIGDTRGDGDVIHQENADCLRGLLWCVSVLPERESLVREVTSVAISAYRKIPGVGPRAVKVGNAAVSTLAEIATTDAVGQLAMLKARVRFGTAQKEIEKAFDAAAATLSLPRHEIEELGVPSYGLEEGGCRIEQLGDYSAVLQVTGSDAVLRWLDASGKTLKAAPAKAKAAHTEELAELQRSLKDIRSMLTAQRDRVDGIFLEEKCWPIACWRERYLDHPLVGSIAGRLLWCVDDTPAFFVDGVPTDAVGGAVPHGTTAEITLWHPLRGTPAEISQWRRRLEELAITQPFKQAHREIYLLTDAERATVTYSNRFAAHVLRQHQFHALCAARGWKNKLRLAVDAEYPPATKDLPHFGLRAEFWIEGAGEDVNDAGSYLRLSTDQVRFYRTGAAPTRAHAGGGGYRSSADGLGDGRLNDPVALADVPALVFSEIMRDVDLFVGVSSIANDPTWQDGGPEGRYRTYWQDFAFGALTGSAATRKEVLERLVPRLAIAERCSFSDRFLVVRGDKRTYRIHLGSGNILMEPNDQYLCIVPNSRARESDGDLYLPFEGDTTLSIIVSKAILLADDTRIDDPTIVRQIDG
jgi:hypothetical protein